MTAQSWFRELLRCPDCASPLENIDEGLQCKSCSFLAPKARDLRPQRSTNIALRFSRTQSTGSALVLSTLDLFAPKPTYVGPLAIRDSRELMSEISTRLPAGGDALDLGCGPRDQHASLHHIGFRYVGIDYDSPAADLLGDAHAIPFADGSFDCVMSYAVLEHLHQPFVAMHEIARVLKPGGWFVGTVSQGEPFHNSYFHHTPWGLISLVQQTPGLVLHRLWPSADTLGSLAVMGRYPRVLRRLLGLVDALNRHLPWLAPRKLRWPLADRQLDRIYRAGSLCFAIQKNREVHAVEA
jgi:SAM-dependent methyltransferase